jgi:hypothetical protein
LDHLRRVAVIASSVVIIAASSLLVLGGTAPVPHADFWRGFALGLALTFMAAGVILIMRASRASAD